MSWMLACVAERSRCWRGTTSFIPTASTIGVRLSSLAFHSSGASNTEAKMARAFRPIRRTRIRRSECLRCSPLTTCFRPTLTAAARAHAQTRRLRRECRSYLSSRNGRGMSGHHIHIHTQFHNSKIFMREPRSKLKSPRLTAWRRSLVGRRLHPTKGRSACRVLPILGSREVRTTANASCVGRARYHRRRARRYGNQHLSNCLRRK